MDVLKKARASATAQFLLDIERIVETSQMGYMDAIVYYCEKNNVEIETVVPMIKSNAKIKSSLQSEGELLNILPKTAKLPV